MKELLPPEDVSALTGNPTQQVNGITAHIGYFVPLAKVADLLTAGVEVGVIESKVSSLTGIS